MYVVTEGNAIILHPFNADPQTTGRNDSISMHSQERLHTVRYPLLILLCKSNETHVLYLL